MSAIAIEKLDRIIHRFANVEHELSSGPSGDMFVKLSKEYAEMEPTAKAAQALKHAYKERDDVDDMLKAGGGDGRHGGSRARCACPPHCRA